MLKHLVNPCAVIALLAGVWSERLTAEDFETRAVTEYRDRYVTRFQPRRRLIYEPKITIAQTSYLRTGWNPWGKHELTSVSVPVVRWVPRWQEELWPVTQREVVPTRRLVQVPARPRTDQIAGDLGPPTKWVGEARHPLIGGITRFDDDVPRTGSALPPQLR